MLDVEHHLALDQEVVGEDQRVLGEVDGALDRVLDGRRSRGRRRRPRRRRARRGIDGSGTSSRRGEVGLGQQRLLGERARAARGSRPADGGRSGSTSRGVTGTGCQDSDVDPTALRALLDDVAAGRVDARRGRGPPVRASRSPTSATPGSTTTARCARACPRPSTARARRRAVRRASSASCWPTGTGPVLLTRATPSRPRPRWRPTRAASCHRDHPRVAADGAHRAPSAIVVVTAGTADRPVADECATVLRGATASTPRADHRRRRGRAAPPAAPRRRARRRRRRGRRRRHGGRAGQRGRRAHRRPGRRRAHQRRATAPRWRASRRCSPCSSSCAAGVTVVGIDNGFGAACAVARAAAARRRTAA